ncbi:uncharacterized protein N7459_000452 [Penicillium hispanicum]|uniref:uncharacterized protein n=1 Tax=Penicillium hispanicum TaxID=1080232 RepID=UPI00254159E6|nr:uncharacterized protein N7459_000452 [Penicillium hispanicum]KAJ5594244.1 hypothetical protein N7459_000452 [Penicillium hispanicum]
MKLCTFVTFFSLWVTAQAAVLPGGLAPELISEREDSSDYQKNVTKGHALWDELQAVLQNPDSTDHVIIDFDENWTAGSLSVGSASASSQFALKHAGLNTEQKFLSVTAKYKQNSFIYYTDAMSPMIGAVVAKNNYGQVVDKKTGVVSTAPNRWSDVTRYLWGFACEKAKKDTTGLNYVIRDNIINDKTKAVLKDAMTAAEAQPYDKEGNSRVTTWTPDDEPFYAALATPNGAGVVYLLKDYPVALGWKTIESVAVFWLNYMPEPTLYFTLKPFCG